MQILTTEIPMTPLMSVIGKRVLQRMRELDLDQYDLAKACRVEQPSISRYIHGVTRRPKFLPELARILKTTPEWIETGKDIESYPKHKYSKHQEDDIRLNDFMAIPEYAIDVGAGNGAIFTESNSIDEIMIPRHMLRECAPTNLENLAVITARGDSMEPTIRDGYKLVIDKGETIPSTPGVYILWDGSGVIVKRLQAIPGGKILVASDNPLYKPYEVKTNQIDIKGRVLVVATWQKI